MSHLPITITVIASIIATLLTTGLIVTAFAVARQ